MNQTDSSLPSQTAPSPSDAQAPLQNLPPGQGLLQPTKPLIEMTDQELKEWHARLDLHRQPQVLAAHLRQGSKASPVQRDISEYE